MDWSATVDASYINMLSSCSSTRLWQARSKEQNAKVFKGKMFPLSKYYFTRPFYQDEHWRRRNWRTNVASLSPSESFQELPKLLILSQFRRSRSPFFSLGHRDAGAIFWGHDWKDTTGGETVSEIVAVIPILEAVVNPGMNRRVVESCAGRMSI